MLKKSKSKGQAGLETGNMVPCSQFSVLGGSELELRVCPVFIVPECVRLTTGLEYFAPMVLNVSG
ncbi:MAG: hypothetical protein AMS27_06950 [Bacteroides sp. SM23_62_1]|nr:MAG: hypothetical protein AMS27_06950 [Bacteroides sp. SM23_62_1]